MEHKAVAAASWLMGRRQTCGEAFAEGILGCCLNNQCPPTTSVYDMYQHAAQGYAQECLLSIPAQEKANSSACCAHVLQLLQSLLNGRHLCAMLQQA